MPSETATRRERTVNWGDRLPLAGSEKKSLPWISVEDACPMTVYAEASVRPSAASAGVVCVATIEWGHGGASLARDYPVVNRIRVPVSGSMVKVSGRLVAANGFPPPRSVTADVSVFISKGVDGETIRNTRWVSQYGAGGELSRGPERVMRVEGYNAGPNGWLMVFDGVAVPGAFPAMARPIRNGRTFAIRRFDSQGFRDSVTWSASATPDTFSPLAGALVRVDAEFLL